MIWKLKRRTRFACIGKNSKYACEASDQVLLTEFQPDIQRNYNKPNYEERKRSCSIVSDNRRSQYGGWIAWVSGIRLILTMWMGIESKRDIAVSGNSLLVDRPAYPGSIVLFLNSPWNDVHKVCHPVEAVFHFESFILIRHRKARSNHVITWGHQCSSDYRTIGSQLTSIWPHHKPNAQSDIPPLRLPGIGCNQIAGARDNQPYWTC